MKSKLNCHSHSHSIFFHLNSLLCLMVVAFGCAHSGSTISKEAPPANSPSSSVPGRASVTEPIKKSPEAKLNSESNSAPNSVQDLINQALRQNNVDTAGRLAGELLMQNPKDTWALNVLAMVQFKKSNFEAAEFLLRRSLAENPNSSEVQNNLGLVLMTQGRTREGVQSFRKSMALNSNNAKAGANLGVFYLKKKDYNKAHLAFEVAYRNGIRDYSTLSNYAVSLSGVGKKQEASEIYEKLLQENKNQKDVLLNYSILLIDGMQKFKEGLDLLNRLKFVGIGSETRELIKQLENRAKAGLK